MEQLTPDEIATELRVTTQIVQLWCRTGKLRATKVGRQWRIKREDLEIFLQEGTKKAVKKAKGSASASLLTPNHYPRIVLPTAGR